MQSGSWRGTAHFLIVKNILLSQVTHSCTVQWFFLTPTKRPKAFFATMLNAPVTWKQNHTGYTTFNIVLWRNNNRTAATKQLIARASDLSLNVGSQEAWQCARHGVKWSRCSIDKQITASAWFLLRITFHTFITSLVYKLNSYADRTNMNYCKSQFVCSCSGSE